MTDDPLEHATAAFRAQTQHEPGDEGLQRLERALDLAAAPRRSWGARVYVLPIAAALFAFGALAAGRVTGLWFRGDVREHEPTSATPVSSSSENMQHTPILEQPVVSVPQPSPSPPVSTVGTKTAPTHAANHTSPPKATSTEAAAAVAPPDLDALYRAAHDAQFKQHDMSAALAGYDRYLRAADPSARLLLEARYNRGLVLRDLGRAHEAKAALQPFADGDYGNYRREEATRILSELAP